MMFGGLVESLTFDSKSRPFFWYSCLYFYPESSCFRKIIIKMTTFIKMTSKLKLKFV